MLVFGVKCYLVVTGKNHQGSCMLPCSLLIQHLIGEWQVEVVTLCDGIELLEVYAHLYLAILLLGDHDRRSPIGMLNWIHELYAEELLDLLFDQFYVLGVHVQGLLLA